MKRSERCPKCLGSRKLAHTTESSNTFISTYGNSSFYKFTSCTLCGGTGLSHEEILARDAENHLDTSKPHCRSCFDRGWVHTLDFGFIHICSLCCRLEAVSQARILHDILCECKATCKAMDGYDIMYNPMHPR